MIVETLVIYMVFKLGFVTKSTAVFLGIIHTIDQVGGRMYDESQLNKSCECREKSNK